MSIHVALNHRTSYSYDRPVQLFPQIVRLRPAPHCRTPILAYSLKITPAQHFINWQQDPQGNYLARLVFPEKTTKFEVEIDLVAEMSVFNPFDFFLEESAREFPFAYEPGLHYELKPFLETEAPGPLLQAFLATVPRTKRATIDFMVELNQMVQRKVDYVIRMEPGVQTCEETLEKTKGSCRDSAWLFVQVLRHLGMAARFVSGYLIQLAPDVKSLDGPSGTEKDFTDLHAWTEVYLPGAGWVGFDPTSGLVAGEGHIPLACSPEPSSAAPITGATEKAEVEFGFGMSVTRIVESPRVTKPYTPEQWAAIDALGLQVDGDLASGDVRLTMGGEPTFISIDDMDGEEWNFTAMGPNKRRLAGNLARRLKNRWGKGAAMHFGQGKWYPGEPLPRWAINLLWRNDGEPIWLDERLLGDDGVAYGYDNETARAFIEKLSDRLDVASEFVIPAHEDAWHYMWQERRLPSNVDPIDNQIDDKLKAERIKRVFEQGLDKVAGYVLPLERRWRNGPAWASGPWFLRHEHLFLAPGDSPLGLRLPLDSLPWALADDLSPVSELDPMEPRPPLDQPRQPIMRRAPFSDAYMRAEAERMGQFNQPRPGGERPRPGQPFANIVRTALCTESRDGKLYVFMPPLARIEDSLDLIAAIEETAAELGTPVFLEGYQPPRDPRVTTLSVTPDPGVIEVNIHPSKTWGELVEKTSGLYEDARQSRLCAEKFMIDGRHVGTGGGNHITLGGNTPADSPLLRRPDLLKSLVGYWNNHPSLSRLFSGLFIGPTSQAPRVDEARDDALYELGIAFEQISQGGYTPPWAIDRIMRNILVDITGNTHRAEFCIDKLYSPDSATGRLGILELRAFEMPPHPQMSLVQQVLLRSLIAKFWRQPYEVAPVRWGGDLMDRWLMPHFIEEDVKDIVEDLNRAGYPMDAAWLAPHLEFRFPHYGHVTQRGIDVDLRGALEPWHVLGEENGGGGTVRYVDASVERLQVKVKGLINDRYAVTCNGRRLPLHSTGTTGEYVAAVRFRAWSAAASLHPTVPAHAPLTFDIVDGWSKRSLGGATYHAAHPGGRNYTTLPVNAYEAESRRLNRFFAMGHTPGTIEMPHEERNTAFPMTLDMRRARPA